MSLKHSCNHCARQKTCQKISSPGQYHKCWEPEISHYTITEHNVLRSTAWLEASYEISKELGKIIEKDFVK